jgi:hypothetical protein
MFSLPKAFAAIMWLQEYFVPTQGK